MKKILLILSLLTFMLACDNEETVKKHKLILDQTIIESQVSRVNNFSCNKDTVAKCECVSMEK